MNRISASVLLPTGIACGGSAWPRHRASRTLAVWGRASFARPHQRPLFAPWVGLRAGEAAEGSPPDWRYRGPAPLGEGYGHSACRGRPRGHLLLTWELLEPGELQAMLTERTKKIQERALALFGMKNQQAFNALFQYASELTAEKRQEHIL